MKNFINLQENEKDEMIIIKINRKIKRNKRVKNETKRVKKIKKKKEHTTFINLKKGIIK